MRALDCFKQMSLGERPISKFALTFVALDSKLLSMFSDIRAAENMPRSVAVLSDRVKTEPALVTLLSRVAGAAIDAGAAAEVYRAAA